MNLNKHLRNLSISKFALIALLFLMPFVNVSCSGISAATLSGINLVAGTSIETQQAFSSRSKVTKIKMEPLAAIALAMAALGLLISVFVKKAIITKINAALALIGAGSLFALYFKLLANAKKEGHGMIQLDFTPFFWLALLLFVTSFVLNIIAKPPQKQAAES